MNVPHTSGGFQNAFDGNAFCGFYTHISGPTGAPNYREYIGTKLTTDLIIGQKYFVSFKLNMPNSLECATNNIGALFSTIPYSETNPLPFYSTPQIITYQIITDTLNWANISGSFISDSAYKYIILGGFYSDSNTDTIVYNGQTFCIAYYFIDMVCVSTDSLSCTFPDIINKVFLSKEDVKIYPNPANKSVFIDLPININKIDVCIVNLLGYRIREKIITNVDNEISFVNIPKGSYIISMKSSQTILNKVLIIN
ncbi:MAG: T9SS type A sorting domain-containing protein [Bacteroidia bacterium]|nr:T9SS type A sorting domain-containing protein [Bacteroidia bacterium]